MFRQPRDDPNPHPRNPQPRNPQPRNPQPRNPQPRNPQPRNPQPLRQSVTTNPVCVGSTSKSGSIYTDRKFEDSPLDLYKYVITPLSEHIIDHVLHVFTALKSRETSNTLQEQCINRMQEDAMVSLGKAQKTYESRNHLDYVDGQSYLNPIARINAWIHAASLAIIPILEAE